MKSNFLKIVLPAFALMLAITASLAFTSVPVEEDAALDSYYQAPDDDNCLYLAADDSDCQVPFTTNGFCTVDLVIPNQPTVEKRVYLENENDGNKCNITLWKKSSI